jgi:UDP-N-acetylglucosamine--dolichyl-phosphate N-acetylglucosaminephosphotransferase
MLILTFFISFSATFFAIHLLIPRLKRAGIVGRDMNKPGQPEIPEMGGLGIIIGLGAGIFLAIAFEICLGKMLAIDLITLLAAFATILLVALIGILDDLYGIGQAAKALLPIFAALPLIAIKTGKTIIKLPFLGPVDFGIYYALILVPLGITGAANGVNVLGGFNGLEIGMGLIATGSLAIIAYTIKATTSFVLLLAVLGALLATLHYNWYPAKVLIGDVGTFSIGAIVAVAVIMGDFEVAGVIVITPYFLDFMIKAVNRFPSKGWWGIHKNNKLHCPPSRPVGLCQFIMRFSGGIRERTLALVLIGIEAVFGLIAVLLYARF